MKKLFILALTFVSLATLAQEIQTYFDPNKAYIEAYDLYKNGKSDDALLLFSKIEKNDSIYMSSLITQQSIYLDMDNYDKVIEIADANLYKDPHYDYSFLLNKAVAIIRKKDYKKAADILENMRQHYPYNYLLEYNISICYENLGRMDDAVNSLKRCIILNAYYESAHLRLGNICYREDKLTQALLCYDTYLLINSTSENALNVLSKINKMVSEKNESTPSGLKCIESEGAFDETDLLLKNYVSLNKKYKTGNDIDIPLVKQNHFLFSYLSQIEGNGDFWDTKYIKFYKSLFNKNKFNGFIYWIMSSTTNQKYIKILNKNKKESGEFISWAAAEWASILSENNVDLKGNKEKEFWYKSTGVVANIGDDDENGLYQGEFVFCGDDGNITSKGDFANDIRIGRWEWYFPNGDLKEVANYTDGELDGENIIYFDNGKPNIQCSYKNDSLHGEYKKFNKFGALIEQSFYSHGKLNGHTNTYYSLGIDHPYYSIDYIDDSPNGDVLSYFSGGEKKLMMTFDNGKNLSEISYYRNGNIDVQYTYSDGVLNGPYKSKYENGNVYEEGNYLNSNRFGAWRLYSKDGKLKTESEYDEDGILINIFKEYYPDGKIYVEYEYKRGDIKAYKYYDKDGNIVKEATKKNGKFFYQGVNYYGNIFIEGNYLFEGGKDGKWNYYSDYGFLRSTEEYTNGVLNGWNYIYFDDSKTISYRSNYSKDSNERKEEFLYPNGIIQKSYWVKNNQVERYLDNFYSNGNLKIREYYKEGQLNGLQEYYSVEGKLSERHYYDNGTIYLYEIFDNDGSILDSINLYSTSEYILHYPNSKVYAKGSYKSGKRHGKYESYYFNGVKQYSGNYFDGKENGLCTWYHRNGKKSMEGNYVYGLNEGVWKSYSDKGLLTDERVYENGLLQGESITYSEDGTISYKGSYLNGLAHGLFYYYSVQGELQMVRRYNQDVLVSYTYEGKDGKLLPEISIENGTANIVCYYNNGQKSREFNMVNGEIDGKYLKYYKTGELAEVDNFTFGKNQGENIEYYQNGQIKIKKFSRCDMQQGEELCYYENGNLKSKKNYIDGVLTGKSEFFNQDGKLIQIIEYTNGSERDEKLF